MATEFGLVGNEVGLRPGERAVWRLSWCEHDIDAGDLVMAELEVARSSTVVLRLRGAAADRVDDASANHHGLAFGEHPGFGGAHAGDVSHRIDTRVPGLQRVGSTGIQPSTHIPDSATTWGTR